MQSNVPYAFISYSSKDRLLAEEVEQALKNAGIQHFRDTSRIRVGDNFKARISHGLAKATHLVLLATPASLKSPWVFFELGQAVASGCTILPLLTHPSLDLPSFLSDFQCAHDIDQLVAALGADGSTSQTAVGLEVWDTGRDAASAPIVLAPSGRMAALIATAPQAWYAGNVAIDGAMELYTFPDHANRYGGIVENQLTTLETDEEWSEVAARGLSDDAMVCMWEGLRSWVGMRRAKPNRIRRLVEPPKQMVIDNNEFQMIIGNSDYFTMRTIAALSRASHDSVDGGPISRVFSSWWSEPGTPFSAKTVPYHLSALGILLVHDPETTIRYLILTLPGAQRTPLVPGWNVSFAEQMWAPAPRSRVQAWWQRCVANLEIEAPADRTGDRNLFATLARGLYEELGVTASDLRSQPRLVMACLEQDMHFLGFTFVLEAQLSLSELNKRRLGAPDKEVGLIAAYPIEGPKPSGGRYDRAAQLAGLMSQESFDGAPFLIPSAASAARDVWHLSSRLRIYALARHLEGNRFLDYVSNIPISAGS